MNNLIEDYINKPTNWYKHKQLTNTKYTWDTTKEETRILVNVTPKKKGDMVSLNIIVSIDSYFTNKYSERIRYVV